MTIQDAIQRADKTKPNMITREMKVNWLAELDGMVVRELEQTHEGGEDVIFEGYTMQTDPETELRVPAPYDSVYIWYLVCNIDLMTGELDRYNNDHALYNNAYMTYSDYYTRTHRPIGLPAFIRL